MASGPRDRVGQLLGRDIYFETGFGLRDEAMLIGWR